MQLIANTTELTGVFKGRRSNLVVLCASIVLGVLLVSFADGARTLVFVICAATALAVLLVYPELALALYVVVGDVKGDDRISVALPGRFNSDFGGNPCRRNDSGFPAK